MTVMISGPQIRQSMLGTKVDRTAATVPATTTANIFTVTGGRILVTSLVGTVTTVMSGTATTLSVGLVPTTGTAAAAGLAAAVAVTSKEVGTQVTLPATLAGNLFVGTNAGAGSQPPASGVMVPAGAISITTSATNTGAMSWSITYIAYDDGASVAAA